MENNQEEISLKELIQKCINWLQYLKSKWKIIFLVGIVGGFLGYGYSFIKKPIYTATLTFALEEKSSGGSSGLSSIASSFGLNLSGGEGGAFAGDNIIELMKSRLLIEKTLLTKVDDFNNQDYIVNKFITINNLRNDWKDNPELLNLRFDNNDRRLYSRIQDSILGEFSKSISNNFLEVSKNDKKLKIITVNVRSHNETFAKIFCENLVKNVTDFYIETKVGKSKKNVLLLESRADSVKNELDQAMYGRASFADQNMGLIRQSAAVPKIKEEMRIQMLGTLYGELIKNLEFSKLTLMREEPLIQIIDKPIYPLQYYKVSKLKSFSTGLFISVMLCIISLILLKLIKQIIS